MLRTCLEDHLRRLYQLQNSPLLTNAPERLSEQYSEECCADRIVREITSNSFSFPLQIFSVLQDEAFLSSYYSGHPMQKCSSNRLLLNIPK